MLQRRVLTRAVWALGLAGAVWGLSGCGQDKPSFRGVDITGADYAQGWELSDQDGQVRTLKDFAGKAVVVFFGFTQCPDVCPTALQEMAQAKQLLGADGAKLVNGDDGGNGDEAKRSSICDNGSDISCDLGNINQEQDGEREISWLPEGKARVAVRQFTLGPDVDGQPCRSVLAGN